MYLKKFLSYYKPYLGLFFKDMFCAMLAAVVSLVFPLIVRYITNTVLLEDTAVRVSVIAYLAVFMIALIIIEYFCNYYIAYKGHVMGAYIEADMRNELFNHYQKLSFSFYDDQKVGQLMTRLTNDLFSLTELCHHGPEDVVISLIKIFGAFIILSTINLPLTLIVFAVLPFMAAFSFYYNRQMKKAFRANKKKIGDINARIEDSLSGIRVVKSFANETQELKRFKKENNLWIKTKQNSYQKMGRFQSGLTAFISLITVIIIVGGTLFLNEGTLSAGDLIAFLLYISNLTDPIKKLINFTESFQEGISGFERYMELLSIKPDIKDDKSATALSDVKGNVSFQDVSFRYNENLPYVLSKLNLDVKAGEYVALVGQSGAGKTTLCSLIPRFYESNEGSIYIDHEDIKSVTLQSLRENIGIVQQDVYLFAGTILENIAYGNLHASEAEIIAASKKANAHDFIMGLEDGYLTDIGQRGVKLSGGQKQRISIARVFLKNPKILIFDEATSALDNESEKVVQESLEVLAKNRTTFVIAHRLSTIKNAERIIVLGDEGIEESGTHDELMSLDKQYAKLYQMQFK